jgi:PIN domain nuclease of toxin-antitoxin system
MTLMTSYTMLHKDPFDRLLIAQALAEDLTPVSADGIFSQYPVSLLW